VTDVLHVVVALVVLVAVVLLVIYVTDWALAKFSAIDKRARLIEAIVAVIVALVLIAMILGFLPVWIRR